MRKLLIGTTAALLLLGAAARFDRLPQGLTATYFSDAGWSSAPVRSRLESTPSTDSIRRAWSGRLPDTFSVTWTGSLLVPQTAVYTFESESDDGAWLFIDGRLVVDDGGRHADLPVRGTVRLDRGVHEIFIRYFQDGGDYAYGLRWNAGDAALAPVPAWALWARHAEFSRMLASALIRRAFITMSWIWSAVLLAWLLGTLWPLLPRAIRYVWSDSTRRTLVCIVAGSVLLNAIGVGWGLPSAWAGDEVTPKAVLIALSRHFSAGWFDRYPPLHFYVLTIAYSPWLLVDALGWVQLTDAQQVMLLATIGRLVSVAASAGTLVAVYVAGAYTFGRRAGLWAAAAMALVPMFVFYSKTANPEASYVFWFAASLALFVRALESGAARDLVLAGVCAAMSICTKDQAYALFISMPFVVMHRWRAVLDRRLALAAAAAAAVFVIVQNIPLNASGFVGHVRDITGPGSNYRMFAPTLAGQLGLLRTSIILDVRAWGWPLFVVSTIGCGLAVRDPRRRPAATALALVAATYYLGFVAVVLYDFDRYLLPICVVQALFAGVALERLAARWAAIAGAVVAYSLLYAATVDALMVTDTRYDAEAWLQRRAGRDRLVATTFPDVVNPRTGTFRSVDLHNVEDLGRWDPDFFVLNVDYARALAPHRPEAPMVAALRGGEAGYRLAYRRRSRPLWWWLPGGHPDLLGPRDETPVLSFLRDLSPTIEIYERVRS